MAMAADLPIRVAKAPVRAAAAPLNWTGFYLGVQAGGVWSKASLSGAFDDILDSSVWASKQSWTSLLIGGFAGYDYQIGRMVVGIEGDLNARSGDGTGSLPSTYGVNVTSNWKSEANWDASLRARLGALVTDQLLLYLTGGVAFSNFKFSNAAVASESNVYWGTRNIYGGSRTGWTAGTGAQYAMTQNWNVRVEYRHTDYGTKSAAGTYDFGKGGPGSYRSKITDDRGTVGLAYKF
jgi:outer membrane immunogenic protein